MFDPIDSTARKGQMVLLRDNISFSSHKNSKCIYVPLESQFRDNISLSAHKNSKCIYVPSESQFLALNYRLHSFKKYSAFVV